MSATEAVSFSSARPIPVTEGWPLVGHLPAMVRCAPELFLREVRAHGTPLALRLGPARMHLFAHPEELERILHGRHQNYIRGKAVDRVRPMLGNGLPLADGDFWLRQRRTMQPLFNRSKLAALAPAMVSEAKRHLGSLRDGQELRAHDLWLHVALDVLLRALFSDALGERYPAVEAALEDIARYLGRYAFLPIEVPLWLPLPDQRRFRRAVQTLDEVVYGLLDSRRDAPPREDLLDALLRARDPETGAPMEPRVLRDEVVNIFFAGHETTANMLTWCTAMLGRHPDVERRLRDEVDSVLGGREPGLEDVPRLEYVSAVLRETLRLHPAAWLFARVAVEDDVVRGHRVPAGTVALLVPWLTHRDPALWPEPARFDPTRFLGDPTRGLAGARDYSYVPFGAGPHVCIGNHFALTEAALALALLYQRGRLVPLERGEPRPQVAATLQVEGALPVRFEARG